MPSKREKVIKQFEGSNPPEDFDFPSIGIEDIDRAVFRLFDTKLRFQTTQRGETKKVPVVFASGERFALTRRKNPIRDRNNTLILPVISVMRTEIDISPSQGGKGTAISFREQPSYVIKRRLSKKDRKYQNLVNKFALKHQDNVAARKNFGDSRISPGNQSVPGTVASRRNGGNLSFQTGGALVSLQPNLGNNIFEIIEIPYPEFVAISYEVTFWTQYLTQANQMMETLMMNFEGQGEEITMKTPEGYELVAFFDQSFKVDNNFSDFTDDERIIKNSINIKVPGYILNPKHPGLPNVMRSYLSAPIIDFGYHEPRAPVVFNNQPERKDEKFEKFVLNDINNIKEIKGPKRGETSEEIETHVINPFTGEKELKYSKVLSRNKRKGETVISSLIVSEIDTQHE